ncbi:MAG: gamma carbonic anhydrase family protein [Micrococcales bacterium]|nr:gamma carbonic anhydrase family protein [Micrococcales bacterium]
MPIYAFDGHQPDIHPSAFVAPTATVIGRVRIEAEASVFYGAVLRGDLDEIVLGAGSNLQDNCVVHTDEGVPTRIGAGVGVGHGAIVHGSTVEDGCLIGRGAVRLTDSVVGAGSLVAAGAVVLEGQRIPPASIAAGVPAKVRGEITDAALRERVAGNAVGYRQLAAHHRGLREL